MTTYTAIPNTDIDQDSPFTQPLITLLRDNPISIAEADSTVADDLRPMPLLGTLTTTSGTTQTLSSLTLTNYRFLRIVLDATQVNYSTSGQINMAGSPITELVTAAVGTTFYGIVMVDLTGGPTITSTNSYTSAFNTAITNATTSISFTTSGVGGPAFAGGAIRVYGEK